MKNSSVPSDCYCTRRRLSNPLQDYKGVVYLPSMMYRAGDLLARGTKKRAITLGAVVGTTLLAKAIPSGDYSLMWDAIAQAGGATAGLCFASFTGGNLLKIAAQGVMDKESLAEEASGANLTENLKKKHHTYHSKVLWDRVWSHEQRYHSETEINRVSASVYRQREGLLQLINPINKSRGMLVNNERYLLDLLKEGIITEEGFSNVFDYCFYRPLNQKIQTAQTNFDMQLIEDWYDGGFLHKTGNKTFEVWKANPMLQEMKGMVKWGKKADFNKIIPGSRNYEKWYDWITTAVAFRRAREGKRLKKIYGINLSMEDLLERSNEIDSRIYSLVNESIGSQCASHVIDDFHESQRRVVGATLHYGYDDAMGKLHKALLPIFLNGTALRAKLDPMYVDDSLGGQSLVHDLTKQRAKVYYNRRINIEKQIDVAKMVNEKTPEILSRLDLSGISVRKSDIVASSLLANSGSLCSAIKSLDADKLAPVVKSALIDSNKWQSAIETSRVFQTLTIFDLELAKHYLSRILD